MKTSILFVTFLFIITGSFAQFKKNEKIIGGSLDILSIKEKNYQYSTGSGPLGNTSAKESFYSLRPEFSYIIAKNTGISIFAEFLSDRYSGNPVAYYVKTKGHAVGLAITEYKFFTKGFGILGRLQGSRSSSWDRTYDTSNVYVPKNKYKGGEISLQPGLFYRFTKHFSLQAIIGRISYQTVESKVEGIEDSKKHYQFTAGFSNISFGVFYIFK